MEKLHPLSTDKSFPYSWLVNLKPYSLKVSKNPSLNASDEACSFIEIDPRMPPSRRFSTNSQEDLIFDFPVSQSSSLTVLSVDELICKNGYLLPLFVESSSASGSHSSNPPAALPTISKTPKGHDQVPVGPPRCHSLRRCTRLSKRVLGKYLDILRPLFRRLRCQKSSSIKPEKRASPGISVAYSSDPWRRSCDSESSILEAVLHCKRSFEK